MLDCNKEIFVWMGRQTLLTERRTAIKAIEVSFLFPFASKKARFSKYLSFSQSVLCSAIIRVLIHTSIVSNFHLLYNIPLRIYILAKIVLLLVSTSFQLFTFVHENHIPKEIHILEKVSSLQNPFILYICFAFKILHRYIIMKLTQFLANITI